MDPVFAGVSRRLADLNREWDRLRQARQALAVLDVTPAMASETKAWLANAALSAGVSGLYTGMEDILRGILATVDGYVPSGERSHQDILDQASVEVAGLRPAVISNEVYETLMDLKGFRHFERHNYRFRFDDDLVERHEAHAEQVVPAFVRDIELFVLTMSGRQ